MRIAVGSPVAVKAGMTSNGAENMGLAANDRRTTAKGGRYLIKPGLAGRIEMVNDRAQRPIDTGSLRSDVIVRIPQSSVMMVVMARIEAARQRSVQEEQQAQLNNDSCLWRISR